MQSKGHPDPGIVAKDALRGIRYALKRGAKMVVQNGPRQLPEQFEAASADFLNSAEQLTRTIDSIATHVLGLQFDPATFGPPSFARSEVTQVTDATLSRDASQLYFALTRTIKYMQIPDLLVSEALCAQVIAEDASGDWPAGDQDTASLCCALYKRILATRILGDPPGVSSIHNADRAQDVATVAFATALWVYVERGAFEDTEVDLLQMCADVTQQKSADIKAAGTADEPIKALFAHALETV